MYRSQLPVTRRLRTFQFQTKRRSTGVLQKPPQQEEETLRILFGAPVEPIGKRERGVIMKYLELLAQIKENLELLECGDLISEAVILPPDIEIEKHRGLIEKLLGLPVKVDIDLKDGFKIEVKVKFKF